MSARILMIEDDREMVTLGKLILEREGYEFISAYDGDEGLKILAEKKNEIDLILLDIMLPQTYGWEVLTKIKTDKATKHIPVIMLTARHYLEDEIETNRYADLYSAYIVKPFVVRELLDKIALVLGHLDG
ncbi:MAG: response regulator [Aliifodinibius sp.]|nr:response regulator [Fodinibius sp.]NIY30295.1 response regulator [Fodinibius sp.]